MTDNPTILDCFSFIKKRLKEQSGNELDYTVKMGWLLHIFDRRNRDKTKFPVVAYRPDASDPEMSENADSMKDSVIISVDGAISIADYTDRKAHSHYENSDEEDPVLIDLIVLRLEVLKALAIEPDALSMPFSSLKFGSCAFDLPEAGEAYAFFSQKIVIELVESLC